MEKQAQQRSYNWTQVAARLSEEGLDEWLDGCKSHFTNTCNVVRCQMCELNLESHKYEYRIIHCKSTACQNFSDQKCSWRAKVLTCRVTTKSDVFISWKHHTTSESPKKPKLTRSMKRLATQLLGSRAKPKRIRHDILDKFEPEKGAAPKLSQVQHFIGHYKRTRLKESDFVEDMEILATGLKYYDEIGSIDPFIFGYEVEGGKPSFGDGTDEHPLVVGVSTPFMLKKLSYANEHIFHIDATYKLNQSGYPTIVLGVSDRARSFHPAAIFITSQVTGPIIHKDLVQLFNMFCVLTGELPEIRYCMADADKAQYNAVQSAVALKTRNPEKLVFLMCFFHVVKNVGEHVSKLFGKSISQVYRHPYLMHFARSEDEFESFSKKALSVWGDDPVLAKFAKYFKKQWLDSVFANWAVFWTPPGYATTSNPVETFNRSIKQDNTFFSLIKLVGLMDRLKLMCRHWSRDESPFGLQTTPNRRMLNSVKFLEKHNCLWTVQPQRTSIMFLMDGNTSDNIMHLCRREDPTHTVDESATWKKLCPALKTKNMNLMEIEDQPVDGWKFDLETKICLCRSWNKYGACVHSVTCLRLAKLPVPGVPEPKRVYFNRRKRVGGRPATVGPALSLE